MFRRTFLAALTVATALPGSALAETPRPPLKPGEVELSLGNDYFARVTPPTGWSAGAASGNEKCWNAPRHEGSFCISTTWIRDRSDETLLKDYLSGIQCEKSADASGMRGPIRTLRRECVVKVGPRKEGRIWYVQRVEGARDAIRMAFHLQRDDKAFMETLTKTIDDMAFFVPAPPKAP